MYRICECHPALAKECALLDACGQSYGSTDEFHPNTQSYSHSVRGNTHPSAVRFTEKHLGGTGMTNDENHAKVEMRKAQKENSQVFRFGDGGETVGI